MRVQTPSDLLNDTLLSSADVAKITGLSPSTLAHRRANGSGPPYIELSRNRVRYRASALRAWIEARERNVD